VTVSLLSMARSRSALPTVLASVLIGTVPLISGCADGRNAPVLQEYSVTYGVSAHAGNVVLRDLLLTTDTTSGAATSLSLQGVVANNTGTNDRLTSVTAASTPFLATGSPASAGASTVPSTTPSAAPSATGAPVSAGVAPGVLLFLGTSGLGLQVTGLKPAALPGSLVPLTFSFQQSGNVTVGVPVYTLASLLETPGPTVTYPTPDVPDGFNQSDFDQQAAPSS
jgi:hypothetical protein